ncbi:MULTISPECIES: rhomboid family intramembrane serine protease [Chitinophaga]|uniref:rhomboid family intramembrane serine protease n=1 Tax=Chitinophaga TaxID=79328 RepID=UPI001CECD447|nr:MULTISPECIES: rhomboid family intramembrane serine protease [Chitinophaga]
MSITSFSRPEKIDEMSMWPYMIKEKKQYYRFITSGFVHGDWGHLFFNMLTLYFFSSQIESVYAQLFGSKLYFLAFYLISIILSDIPSYIKHHNNYAYRSIGASGAVSAVVFSFILFSPWSSIYVFFVKLPAIIYGVLFLGLSAYMSRRGGDNINHDAHFWGAIVGLAFPLILRPELFNYFINQLMSKFQ